MYLAGNRTRQQSRTPARETGHRALSLDFDRWVMLQICDLYHRRKAAP